MSGALRIYTRYPVMSMLRHPLLHLLLLLHLPIHPLHQFLTHVAAIATVRSGAALPTPYVVSTDTFTFDLTWKHTEFVLDPNDTEQIQPYTPYVDYEGPRTISFFPSIYSGVPLPLSNRTDYMLSMRIMHVPTKYHDNQLAGCKPWVYSPDYEGAWLLMDAAAVTASLSSSSAASCLDVRYTNAAQSGAAGIIVVSSNCGLPLCDPWTTDGCVLPKCEPLESLVIKQALNITVISISILDGAAIEKFLFTNDLAYQAEMWMQIKSSVTIDPDEKAALIDIMTHTKMGSFAQTPALDILPYWSLELFSQDDFDPCRNRIKGIWCEGPNVVLIEMYNHGWTTPNGIPASFRALTQLRYLAVHNNAWTHAIPNEWCELQQLRVLKIQEQLVAPYITALPICDGYYITVNRSSSSRQLDSAAITSSDDNATTTNGTASNNNNNNTINITETSSDGGNGTTINTNTASNNNGTSSSDPSSPPSSTNIDITIGRTFNLSYSFWPNLEELTAYRNGLTSLPTQLGDCIGLVYLRVSQNQLRQIPSLYLLDNLVHLDLSQNQLTGQLPNISGSTASWDTIAFSNNAFSGSVPEGMFDGRVTLRIVDLNNNRLTGALPSFKQPNRIEYLDLSSQRDLMNSSSTSIGFSGPIPAWGFELSNLVELYLQENSLQLPIGGGSEGADFNGKGSEGDAVSEGLFTFSSTSLGLKVIDLSHNLLNNWKNSSNTTTSTSSTNIVPLGSILSSICGAQITSVRLSYNQLQGQIGFSDVTGFQGLQKLYLDHNMVTDVWAYSFSLPALTFVDQSYNNISLIPISFQKFSPPAIFSRLNLIGNPYLRLNASQFGWMTVATTRTLTDGASYACSMLGSTTSETMSLLVDPQAFEYQYCECQIGTFGRAPLCSSVPVQARVKPYEMIVSDEVGTEFAQIIEASVGGIIQNLTQPGLQQNETADYLPPPSSSQAYLQSFSDSMYGGTERLTIGMATSWVVDVSDLWRVNIDAMVERGEVPSEQVMKQIYQTSNPSEIKPEWTPVRVLTIRIHLSTAQFSSSSDLLSIYEGGSDLKGDRVFTLRGNDLKTTVTSSAYTLTQRYQTLYSSALSKLDKPCLLEISVFSPIATVSFSSRSTQGLHFVATYSYDFVCPSGYFYDTMLSSSSSPSSLSSPSSDASVNTRTGKCRPTYLIYSPDSSIRSAVLASSGITLFFITATICVLLWNFNHGVFKAASRSFLLLILVFMELMTLGSMLFAAIPDVSLSAASFSSSSSASSSSTSLGNAVCNGRVWLTCLPLAAVLGIILAKNRRMWAIFGATTLQVTIHSDLDLLISVTMMCLAQCVLLSVFSGLGMSVSTLSLGSGSYSDRLVVSCSQETGFMSWIAAEVCFIAVMMIGTAYLGFKTRNLPSQYNESQHLQNALIILILYSCIIIPLAIFIQNDPNASILIQGLGLSLLSLILTMIIFGPKLYIVILDLTYKIDLSFNPTMSSTGGMEARTGGTGTKTPIGAGIGSFKLGSIGTNLNTIIGGGEINSNGSKGKESTILSPRRSSQSLNHNTSPKLLSTTLTPTSPSATSPSRGVFGTSGGGGVVMSNVPIFRTSVSLAKVASLEGRSSPPSFTTTIALQNVPAGDGSSSGSLPLSPSSSISSSPPPPPPLIVQQGEPLIKTPVTPLPELQPDGDVHQLVTPPVVTAEVHV